MNMNEQRQDERHPVRQRAILVIGDELHGGLVCGGEVLDISLEGGLFAPDPAFRARPGLACRLPLMNGRNPSYLSLPAVVAGTRQRCIALRFPDPGADGQTHSGTSPASAADARGIALELLTA